MAKKQGVTYINPNDESINGLKGINVLPEYDPVGGGTTSIRAANWERYNFNRNNPVSKNIGLEYPEYGNSRYDTDIHSLSQLQNINNTRGELQPWYDQILAGIGKGVVTAGTTFLDGTLGLIAGVANIPQNGLSGYWDNPITRAMKAVGDWSEQAMPNYYTDEEKNNPWYDNIFTSNFLGNTLIKNAGFGVGAFYSGKAWLSGLSAIAGWDKLRQVTQGAVSMASTGEIPTGANLIEDLAVAAPKLRKADAISKIVGVGTSALGEASIQVLNDSDDWANQEIKKLNDYRDKLTQDYTNILSDSHPNLFTYSFDSQGNMIKTPTKEGKQIIDNEINKNFNYDENYNKIVENKNKMGNVDFLLQLPLLMVSNLWQFGKLYSGGFKTAKTAENILKNVTEDGVKYVANNPSRLATVGKVLQGAIAEGPVEEMGQSAISKMAGYKYGSELNNFYGAKIDPDSEEKTIGWLKASAKALTDTYGKAQGWEDGFVGALTGLVGMPGFRNIRNEEGGLQSPIYLRGGAKDEIKELREERKNTNDIVNLLNNRIQSPQFLNYYQGAIRHNKYQNDMDNSSLNNDNFEFKNAEHSQLISDAILFSRAGRLQDLYDIIDKASNVSIDDITKEGGILDLTKDKITGINKAFVDKSPEEIQKILKDRGQDFKKQVDNYVDISSNLRTKIGDKFNTEGLDEMTWMLSSMGNLEDRFKSLHEDVKSKISNILSANEEANNIFFKDNKEDKEKIKLTDLISMSPEGLLQTLSNSKEAQLFLLLSNKALSNDPNKSFLIDDINDMIKIANRRIDIVNRYKDFISNPEKLNKEINEAKETIINNKKNQDVNNLKIRLEQSENLKDFKNILDEEEDINIKQEVLDNLIKNNNKLAKDYKDTESYKYELNSLLQNSVAPDNVKNDAKILLKDHFDNSENINNIKNKNSNSINNESLLFDTSKEEGDVPKRHYEAKSLIHNLIDKLNSNKDYLDDLDDVENADTIISDFKDPRENTTIIVNSKKEDIYKPEDTGIKTVSNIEINSHNKELNKEIDESQKLDKDKTNSYSFYKPTIPETHIEASKEGDFRPFNIVVKENEPNVNFDNIYNYFISKNTFNYINEGNLKVGDDIGFMIDPSYNDHTIFMIDKKTGAVVGSLDESEYSIKRYKGLKNLVNKIQEDFKNTPDKTKQFVYKETTKVSQIMLGKVPYGTEERSLKDIPGVNEDSAKPLLAVMKNGRLTTNNTVSDKDILYPADISGKEGRVYLLIPNAQGKYNVSNIRIQHFNNTELNPKDVINSKNVILSNIINSIKNLATVKSGIELQNAVNLLNDWLYVGKLGFHYINKENTKGIYITPYLGKDDKGNDIWDKTKGKSIFFTEKSDTLGSLTDNGVVLNKEEFKDSSDIENELINTLLDFNLPVQVNSNRINTNGYNKLLINNNVFTSTLLKASTVSSWFTTDYFDEEGKLQSAYKYKQYNTNANNDSNTPTGGKESIINGVSVDINENKFIVDLKTNKIYNDKGKEINPYNKDILLALAYVESNFPNQNNSSTMINGKCLLPNGKAIDKNTKSFLNDEELNSLKKDLETHSIFMTFTSKESKKSSENSILPLILENQKRIDLDKSNDSETFILEDDGNYYSYPTVSPTIGFNKILSKNQSDALREVQVKLSRFSNNINDFNKYVKQLSNYWKINLSEFYDKSDVISREKIIDSIRESLLKEKNYKISKDINVIVSSVFNNENIPDRPEYMDSKVFNTLITNIIKLKENIENNKEKIVANNIIVYHKYNNNNRVSSKIDLVTISEDSKYNLYNTGYNKDYTKEITGTRMSQKEYDNLLLSGSKNIFESHYNVNVNKLGIIPFNYNYGNSIISSINISKGIKIDYNPQVTIPLETLSIQGMTNVEASIKQLDSINPTNVKRRPKSKKELLNPSQNKELAKSLENKANSENNLENKNKISNFDSLENDVKDLLIKKGWTEEAFNNSTQEEKEQAVKCAS